MVYFLKPCSDVFCFKLNFKILKLGYYQLCSWFAHDAHVIKIQKFKLYILQCCF